MEKSLESKLLKVGVVAWAGAGVLGTVRGYQWASEFANNGDNLSAIFIGCFTTAYALIMASPFISYFVEKYQKSGDSKANQKV
jgi:hypothetical protein